MRHTLWTLAFLGLATGFCPAPAQEGPGREQGQAATTSRSHIHAYLGVEIEPISPALASQLADVVPKGEGLLVGHVAQDSPAAKAGLESYDILLSYSDQPLHSADQLIKLVRADAPGREVSIRYVRGGKSATCKVTLGERTSAVTQERRRVFRFFADERLRHMFEEHDGGHEGPAWESFESMKLTRLDTKRWRAEIDYHVQDGKKEHKTFEGTHEEIRKDILAAKDLPDHERHHLLRALDLHDPVFEFHFPPFGPVGPGGGEHP